MVTSSSSAFTSQIVAAQTAIFHTCPKSLAGEALVRLSLVSDEPAGLTSGTVQHRIRQKSREGDEMATTKKASGSKGGGKGLAAEVQPSADLSAIVGSNPMPRSEITKKVWDYIKAHGLQDQQNKRMINADDNLKKIFNGKKQVSMFEMTALVNKHLKA
jgi:upstream activation factor subunit UAF30